MQASKRFDSSQPACLGVFLVGSSSLPAARLPFLGPVPPIDKRADDLLGRITLDERIALPHPYAPAVERLGIASFRTGTEALHGVSWLSEARLFPQAVGLGAPWDEDLIHQVAEAVSIELRAFHYTARRRTASVPTTSRRGPRGEPAVRPARAWPAATPLSCARPRCSSTSSPATTRTTAASPPAACARASCRSTTWLPSDPSSPRARRSARGRVQPGQRPSLSRQFVHRDRAARLAPADRT